MSAKTKALKGEKAARMSDNGVPGKKLSVKDKSVPWKSRTYHMSPTKKSMDFREGYADENHK